MTKRYNYRIFPTTFKARLLLVIAFALGAVVFAAYIAFFVFLSFSNLFDEKEVTYVNRTDQELTVYIDDLSELTLAPGESETRDYYRIEWWFDRDVAAVDSAGRVVWERGLDDGDLEDTRWRIVLQE